MTKQDSNDKRDEIIARLREALSFYADPGTYHAVSFMFDPPCGGFQDDFSDDHGDYVYEGRRKPGKLARQVLRESQLASETLCEVHGTPLVVEPVLFCQECTDEA